MKRRHCFLSLFVGIIVGSTFHLAQPTNLVAADPVPLKDLDGHFPFQPPASLDAWKERSEQVRRQIQISQGVWPMPTLAAMKPTIHSEKEMDGYALSKVYFESLPGFYVTGTLYTPRDGKASATKRPAVLCPHGHWDNGRFYQASDSDVRKQLATGAERFESAARNPMQARCVQLARMGCVVFFYDMIGYADSQQISFERAHRYGVNLTNPPRTDGAWLLYSATAEGNMQSTMGLQTINSLQAFEFLASRPDVDPQKIAITGASGGGTQTFIAASIEPRIAAAAPAVMVSTRMQGGCTCENSSLLRVGTGNVEMAATIAPRPLAMISADDWTKSMPTDGYPEIQKIYDLFGAKENVAHYPYLHFPHNYNHVSRVALYGFINRTFELGHQEPILERDFEVLRGEDLTVWNEQHVAPEKGEDFEARLLRSWRDDLQAKVEKDGSVATAAWEVLLSPSNQLARELQVDLADADAGGIRIEVKNSQGETVAKGLVGKEKVASLLFQSEGDPSQGSIVVHDPYGLPMQDALQPVVKNPRPAPAYTYGYNPSLAQRRAGVALAILDRLKREGHLGERVVATGKGEEVSLLRLIQKARPEVIQEVTTTNEFDVKSIENYRHPAFVPGMFLYGLVP